MGIQAEYKFTDHDVFRRLDTIHECDRRTDRHQTTASTRCYTQCRAVKIVNRVHNKLQYNTKRLKIKIMCRLTPRTAR